MNSPDTKEVLFVMQLPPPVHGVSVMNEIIRNSGLINSNVGCTYINLATASDLGDLRRFSLRKVGAALAIYTKVILRLARSRYRFVYVTVFPWGAAFLKDSIVVLLARLFGQKPLIHLHTYGFKKQARRGVYFRWYYRYVFRNCEVICLSRLLIEDVEEIFTGKVHIVPNGIPQVNFVNQYDPARQPVRMLYLSNLIEGKGILLILEAAKILADRNIGFHLDIAGPEADITYARLKKMAQELGIERYITFYGPVYGEQKYDLLRRAGIFLLPSNYDTFGLVLLEAMQFGVPCIASRMGGIPDVLGDGRGVLLDALTARDLADKAADLIADPEKRAGMSKFGFSYFSSNFTVAHFEQRLLEVLARKDHSISIGREE